MQNKQPKNYFHSFQIQIYLQARNLCGVDAENLKVH